MAKDKGNPDIIIMGFEDLEIMHDVLADVLGEEHMTTRVPNKKYWIGDINPHDDFGVPIRDQFIDGKTKVGSWAIMTPASWRRHGIGHLGLGRGQRYLRQEDGKWLKVEG